jgi:hypothetical protein
MSILLRKISLASVAFCLSLLSGNAVSAQIIGGRHVFSFLSLPQSARVTGLGGAQIAVRDDDPVFAISNPGALNPAMSGRMTFNHNFFLGGIKHGYVSYAQYLPKWGFTMHGGIQYMGYGEIKRADEFGDLQGTVKAGETAFTLGAARPLSDKLSLGLNARMAFSKLDEQLWSYLVKRVQAIGHNTLKITHQEIAQELHSPREVITRLLHQLQKQNKVELSRGEILVHSAM